MKWPFARHTNTVPTSPGQAPADGGVGSITTTEPTRPEVVSTRRDWATLPPLQVAGARPISLTVHARAFTESLVTQQILVHNPRLEHVRQLDAPSGSFRGVLAPAVVDHDRPELQEPSPLPAVEHRHAAALNSEPTTAYGQAAIDHLLSIGPPTDDVGPAVVPDTIEPAPFETFEPPADGGAGTRRRVGLADSRRMGLGPAYHGPLPEAMRAERERDDRPDGGIGVSVESVPGDVRATMRDILGVDVGDRLVHRGPAVSAEAEAMGAQAFTRDGQIYLHDDVGPLDQPRGRATVAHELTHAAQQIVHGVLHDEATEVGQALEAHAQRVEQFVRGDGGAIKPTPDLLHARPPAKNDQGDDVVSSAQQMMREMVDSGLAKSDGSGGIIFTMPPSSMTASAGTQRLAGDAPTAHAAASPSHWDPLASFGNTLSQGLGNDMLGIAGSMFGFSDEFMGEQRHELSAGDRQFRREQTTQAYSELRMEHLRRVELTNLNDLHQREGLDRASELDAATLQQIEDRVNSEITERLTLLDAQTAAALERLNQQRATRREAALLDVPDPNFTAALTALFDNADDPVLPTEEALLTTLAAPATTGRGARPGGGATPHTTGASTGGTPTAHPTGTPAASASTATHPTGAPAAHEGTGTEGHSGSGTDTHPTGTGAGAHTPGAHTGAATPEQHWRTDATMGGRFGALGEALAGDIAHAELGFFGSLLGFDSAFERDLHGQVGTHPAAAGGAAGAHTDAAHPTGGAHPDAAHPDAAHPAATGAGAAHTGAAGHPGAAHQTVESIVDDPYALDELATRLYPTIRSRLRQELLIDRERAGLLADFR